MTTTTAHIADPYDQMVEEWRQQKIARARSAQAAAAAQEAERDPDTYRYPMDRPWTVEERARYDNQVLAIKRADDLHGAVAAVAAAVTKHPKALPGVLAVADALSDDPELLELPHGEAADRLTAIGVGAIEA